MADPTSLFIGQLCPSTNEKDLEACFDKYGPVVKATVVRDRETGESKGFGFVQFETSTEANDAINGANGAEIKGSAITVEMSREKRQFNRGDRGGFEQRRGGMRNSEDSYRGRGGYSRGGYGRPPREFNSDRMGSRSEGYDSRGRGSSRAPPRFSNNRDEDRYSGGDRRGGSRYERQEERYEPQENSYGDRYSSEQRPERRPERPERRPRTEWHEEEYEEPRERRSSFGSRGGGVNPRGGYSGRGHSSRGDHGGRSEYSRGGGYSGGSDRGGFSRRGSDRGSHSGGGGGGDRYASRSERPPREENKDWYGAGERRSVSESRPTSSDRYSRHREDDGGFRGRGRGRPRGVGRGGRGSYSGGGGRGSYGGSNRSFGEDY